VPEIKDMINLTYIYCTFYQRIFTTEPYMITSVKQTHYNTKQAKISAKNNINAKQNVTVGTVYNYMKNMINNNRLMSKNGIRICTS